MFCQFKCQIQVHCKIRFQTFTEIDILSEITDKTIDKFSNRFCKNINGEIINKTDNNYKYLNLYYDVDINLDLCTIEIDEKEAGVIEILTNIYEQNKLPLQPKYDINMNTTTYNELLTKDILPDIIIDRLTIFSNSNNINEINKLLTIRENIEDNWNTIFSDFKKQTITNTTWINTEPEPKKEE